MAQLTAEGSGALHGLRRRDAARIEVTGLTTRRRYDTEPELGEAMLRSERTLALQLVALQLLARAQAAPPRLTVGPPQPPHGHRNLLDPHGRQRLRAQPTL